MKNHDPIHEAVCKAAGWPAYCENCGAKTVRVPQMYGAESVCPHTACNEKLEEARAKFERYWEAPND